jgi:hypothetical protein
MSSIVGHFDAFRSDTFIVVKILGALGDHIVRKLFLRMNPSPLFKK